MSEILEMKILKGMRKSDHFSILLDETTVTEQFAVHGCFITSTGGLSCCFLSDLLQSVSTGLESISANAQTNTDRVCEFMTEAKLEISKLRGIVTDGASTMIGCKNGVVTRLKSLVPSAISVHCAAHW